MKIKDLGTIIKGRTPPTGAQEYWNGDIPFVTTKDLQSGKYILSTERSLSHKGLLLYPKNILPQGAVCVSCTGNLGYVGITTKPCMTNQQILAIVPDDNNDPEYIYYLMKSMWQYFKQIEGHSTVTSQISKEKFSDIEINIPELSEQHDIAATLSAFDELLDLNSQKANNLTEQLKLIYEHYVSGSHEMIPLGKLCTIKYGTYQLDQSDNSFDGGDIKWLCTQDITGTFVTNTSRYITKEALSDSKGKQDLIPAGTIVVSIVGTIGRTAITTGPMCINAAIAYVIPKNSKIKEFIYTYLLCQYEYLNKIATGSVLKRININTLKLLPVPILSDEQYENIIDIIDPYFLNLRQIHDENIVITQARDIAIKKLFENTLL
ncbi:MAG: restriction endonuclease subunit S [Ruminiclostridium sp.]|nr:restriction endonuclease subunit S [Ruminiclostridium sp.]